MKLLVCGGRDFRDREALKRWMNEAVGGQTDVTVIHGGARGADSLAGEIATSVGVPCLVFPADWERNGLRTGPIRNQWMLDEGQPDLVLAAPGGRGTANMVRRAAKAGVRVINKGVEVGALAKNGRQNDVQS